MSPRKKAVAAEMTATDFSQFLTSGSNSGHNDRIVEPNENLDKSGLAATSQIEALDLQVSPQAFQQIVPAIERGSFTDAEFPGNVGPFELLLDPQSEQLLIFRADLAQTFVNCGQSFWRVSFA